MAIIRVPLTHGKFALIDEADLPLVSWRSWRHNPYGGCEYAVSEVRRDGKRIFLSMHRVILGVTDPAVHVDHINGDGLDNRRSNLRLCTQSTNQANRRVQRNNPTGLKGVSQSRGRQRWQASIKVDGHQQYLGLFDSPEEAARAYDAAAREAFGAFARTNFPEEAA